MLGFDVIMLFNFKFINKAPKAKIAPPNPTKLSPKLPTIIDPAAEPKEIPKFEAIGLSDEAKATACGKDSSAIFKK